MVAELHELLGAAALLLLVLGLLRAYAGTWPARSLTLAVAGVLFASVLDPGVADSRRQQPRLRVVATGTVSDALRRDLGARLAAALDLVEASPDPGELAVALRGAAGPAADERALLWLQPIGGDGVPAAGAGNTRLFTAEAPLEFEPAAVHLRAAGASRVGRPLLLELVGLPPAWRGDVVVTAPDGSELARTTLADQALPTRVEALPVAAGVHQVRVQARAGAGEFAAHGEFEVAAAPPLLAVGAAAEPLAAALRAQGYAVESSEALPAELAHVDGVVLARVLTLEEQERLRAYVDDGGGAFLVGAPDGGALPVANEVGAAMSPVLLAARPSAARPDPSRAGDRPTGAATPPVPTPTPVPPAPDKPAAGDTSKARPDTAPERDVERRMVAMVFVLDRSESMLAPATPGGPTRMDYVRSSAQATASKLMPGDELAIVTFGNRDAEEVVLPLTPATEFGAVHGAFAQVAARRYEGTYVDSALDRATLLLAESRAAVKHVVVITDGLIEDLVPAIARARAMREGGATVSMIRFGGGDEVIDAGRLCRQFAEFGGGKYMHSTSTAEVPALVSSEVKRVIATTGRRMADEGGGEGAPVPGGPPAPPQPEVPDRAAPPPPPVATAEAPPRLAVRVVEDSPLLASLPADGPPAVSGILPVSARPEARTLLVAGGEGRPLLALQHYGLGRVAAWTADLGGAWSAEWRAAPAFPAWLAQWVAALAPPVIVESVDVLRERQVQPLGPTPSQVAALERFCGERLRDWRQAGAPAATVVPSRRSIGDVLAFAGALGVLLLALVEFLLARRGEAAA